MVVPNLHLPNILGDKTDLVQQAFGSGNDLVGNVQDPTQDLLLKIGDLISFFGAGGSTDYTSVKPSLDLNSLDTHGISDLAGSLGGIAGGLAAAEKLGSLISIVHLLKYKVLHVISVGLQIANIILAIIGLAMIIGKCSNTGRHFTAYSFDSFPQGIE